MIEKPAIKSLHIQNLLSFGPNSPQIALEPLNVLIGPNGSGKSNFIEVIGLLQNTPKDLATPIREGGGVVEWLWKRPKGPRDLYDERRPSAERTARSMPTATIEVSASPAHVRGPIRYRLSFTGVNYQLDVRDERVEAENPSKRPKDTSVYFGYVNGRPMLKMNGSQRELPREQINPQQSILSQRKDPAQYPELTYLGQLFGGIRIYRNWEFGPICDARNAFGPEQSTEFLDEDISNLGLMLNRLNSDPDTKSELLKYLKLFYDGADAVETPIQGGLVDVRLIERGGVPISAVRLSDGTLRWLALLTILLHPSPPPLVCIEEPELGLHPDIIPPLAQLLREASQRMQLIIATHSNALVDELTDVPEAVIVCEKEAGSTVLKRLERKQLSAWLKSYTLGHLWRKGEIGGNRW
jgi:predicted ATPase